MQGVGVVAMVSRGEQSKEKEKIKKEHMTWIEGKEKWVEQGENGEMDLSLLDCDAKLGMANAATDDPRQRRENEGVAMGERGIEKGMGRARQRILHGERKEARQASCPDRDSSDLPCVVLCCGVHRCSFVKKLPPFNGVLMIARKERDGKCRRRRVGWQVKYVRKSARETRQD